MKRLNKFFIITDEARYNRAKKLHIKAYQRASKRFRKGLDINCLYAYGFVRVCNDNIEKSVKFKIGDH